jgi:hypothetical protein
MQTDPDEYVPFTVVRSWEGPLLVERLRQAGIDAISQEAFNVATSSLSDHRILVRRRDLEAAEAVA